MRSNVDEFEVKMVRMQNFGISLNQIVVSVLLLSFGILTYYSIPWAFINAQTGLFSFYINLLLLFLVLGMIFTS
jgi:NADH:ubiquinone oxidoreductase subunit 3 (subunit A)